MNVGIVGLGLIGGSLGLALKKMKHVDMIYGYDISEKNQKDALELGLVNEIVGFDKLKKISDVIFLAIPVEAIKRTLNNMQDIDKNTTIIDLGSTKSEILKDCPDSIKSNLVAAHPMAGTENSGPKAAFMDLFAGAYVIICDDMGVRELHIKRAVEIFSHVGMKIIFMDSINHDHHVAFVSHLPHAISFALVNSVMKEEDKENIINLDGGSFTSMSRIAKSSPIMWSDIFRQNKQNLMEAIKSFKNELDFCINLIENENWQELNEWMSNARKIREIL